MPAPHLRLPPRAPHPARLPCPTAPGLLSVAQDILPGLPPEAKPRGEDATAPLAGSNTDTLWPQVGMGNADYVAAFLHVLLPLAFEVTAWGRGWSQWQEGWRGIQCPGSPQLYQSGMEPWAWGGSLWRGLFYPCSSLFPVSLHPPCPQFDPELVLVAAGFDSAVGDPEVRAWPG